MIANLIYSLVRVHLRTYLLPSMYPTIYVEGILSLSDLSRHSTNSPFNAVCPAADATTTNNKDDDADNDGDDDNDDAGVLEGKLPAIMPPKKKTLAAAFKTKAVDAITDALKKASVSSPKAPAFVPYLTKVTDAYFVCTFIEGGKRFVEVDLNLAAALCSNDGIKAVLSNDGMNIQFQRGVVFIILYDQVPPKGSSHCLQPGQ